MIFQKNSSYLQMAKVILLANQYILGNYQKIYFFCKTNRNILKNKSKTILSKVFKARNKKNAFAASSSEFPKEIFQ